MDLPRCWGSWLKLAAADASEVLVFDGVIAPQDGPELLIEAAPLSLKGIPGPTSGWSVMARLCVT